MAVPTTPEDGGPCHHQGDSSPASPPAALTQDDRQDFHYLVPDEQVELASKLLCEDQGLPLSLPPPLLVLDGGDFYVKARMHRVSHDKSLASAQHLVLYPASFADYSPTDLVPMPRYAGIPHPLCKTVLVPSPPAVYASIFRMMKAYSRFDPVQIAIQSDLAQLVDYHLYSLNCGYVDMDDEELCDDLEVDRRIDDAVRVVQSWRRTYFLGADDWIGDALEKIVSGRADIEDVLRP